MSKDNWNILKSWLEGWTIDLTPEEVINKMDELAGEKRLDISVAEVDALVHHTLFKVVVAIMMSQGLTELRIPEEFVAYPHNSIEKELSIADNNYVIKLKTDPSGQKQVVGGFQC